MATKKQSFLIVARLPGEIALLRRGVYLGPNVEVHEVLVKDLTSIKTREYVGAIIGASVCKEDREIGKALVAANG